MGGAIMTLEQCRQLSGRWYGGRFDPDGEPFSPAEKQSLFNAAGLTDDFWQLGP